MQQIASRNAKGSINKNLTSMEQVEQAAKLNEIREKIKFYSKLVTLFSVLFLIFLLNKIASKKQEMRRRRERGPKRRSGPKKQPWDKKGIV
jgi:lipopolysaccharide export LptBFGC system permease protein LptF